MTIWRFFCCLYCLTVTSSFGSLGQEYGSHTVQLVLASCSYIFPIQDWRHVLSSDSCTRQCQPKCQNSCNSFAKFDTQCPECIQSSCWISNFSSWWRQVFIILHGYHMLFFSSIGVLTVFFPSRNANQWSLLSLPWTFPC